VCGIGLEVDFPPENKLPIPEDGEVGSVVLQAFLLFRDVLESNTETTKFMRAMILLEFLASPEDFINWKDAKHEIACHIATSRSQYEQIGKRIEELTGGLKTNGKRIPGFRTRIVHQGKHLEDLIPKKAKRSQLFHELQGYVMFVVDDMLSRTSYTWEEFCNFRNERKQKLGVMPFEK
jgi:hypothetical protein